MKKLGMLLTLFAVSMFTIGCGGGDAPKKADDKKPAAEEGDKGGEGEGDGGEAKEGEGGEGEGEAKEGEGS